MKTKAAGGTGQAVSAGKEKNREKTGTGRKKRWSTRENFGKIDATN
ncbi:hypothetical protein [Aristaeella lactis]|nr:hypothetical protein [Aristaeella lactis]QUA51993.1 hypothetical protein JYE50_09705 [Aristaeella lactis]